MSFNYPLLPHSSYLLGSLANRPNTCNLGLTASPRDSEGGKAGGGGVTGGVVSGRRSHSCSPSAAALQRAASPLLAPRRRQPCAPLAGLRTATSARYGAPKTGAGGSVCVWGGGGREGPPHLSAAPTAASRAGPLLGHAPLPRPHSPALPTAGWRPPPRGRAEGPAGGGAGPPAAGSPKGGKSPAAAPRRPLSAAPPPASASCARPGLVPPRSAAL